MGKVKHIIELPLAPSESNASFEKKKCCRLQMLSDNRLEMDTAKVIFISKTKFRLSYIGFHTC